MINTKKLALLLLMFVTLLTILPSAKRGPKPLSLISIHIVDRNGFTETISSKDRLSKFQNVDFLKSQPYQKVLRIFSRNKKGDAFSIITTYHPNGNIKQYLDVVNARANGTYREWHANGQPSVAATVIGGAADITHVAEQSWIFDQTSLAWNEDGGLIASIQYCQGELQGPSIYYHSSGNIWKIIPYDKNEINGDLKIYLDTGALLQQTAFYKGVKHGSSLRYWPQGQIAAQEEYLQGKLEKGCYFSQQGELISEVNQGFGFRAVFGKENPVELQEYKRGILEGEVKVFNKTGQIIRIFRLKNGMKHGEEMNYYETPCSPLQPKLSVHWYEGKIQGLVKSWYPNGVLESQKEMSNNTKNGFLRAWYTDGNMMLIEQYDTNKIIKGDYFKKGEKSPISQIVNGKGTATIFDSEGHFIQKIQYNNGKPGND